MREIKFRGKRIRPKGVKDAWAYGSLIQKIESTEIHDSVFTWFIHPETVGQFTGLKDKNGKEIYEGDICRLGFSYCDDKIGVVYFKDGCFYVDDKHPLGNLPLWSFREGESNIIEVIGNIHDNPELLKQ